MSDITIRLNEAQARVLHEILNITGLELTALDASYGSDSIETIVGREPELDEVNVTRVAHRLFDQLTSILEQFEEERDA
jgi:hypothetical protein